MAQPAPPPGVPPAGPPVAPPPYPPTYPPPYYYPPPPPKSTNVVLIIVVVIIVVVAITVILSAVLYFMVSGLLTDGGGNRPVVALAPPNFSGNTAVLVVAGVSSPAKPFTDFSATLIVNATLGTRQPVTSNFTITVAGDPYPVTFSDIDGNGLLSLNDEFTIAHAGGFPPGTDYTFELLWTDLSPVAFRSWTTP